jgi:hypothetical protein
MQVEGDEGIVICPHCETALQIPGFGEIGPSSNGDESATPAVIAAESVTVPDSSVFPGFPIGEDGPPSDSFPTFTPEPPESAVGSRKSEVGCRMSERASNSADLRSPTSDLRPPEPADPETPTATAPIPDEAPHVVSAGVAARRGVPGFLFVLLAGYACAVTIALIWLWWTRGRVHPLESLPDLVPKTAAYVIEESTPLPPEHTLRLGETRRFGNLEVTPLRVTRGPVMVVSVSDGDEESPNVESGMPVLKLWLRIRNVSDDQTIRPFGRELLRLPANSRNDRFNTFVCRADQKRRDGDRVLVYYLTREERELALQGQQADRELGPGETYETFIATSERGIEELNGDLVWRVHFRKGLNPASRRGVTTLIEVTFHSDAIQEESAASDAAE